MIETLNKTKNWILDVLLPRFCVGCGREGQYICKDCEIFLSEVEITPGLDGKTPGVGTTISVWEYEGLMEELIQKIKFDGCFHIIDELVEKALEKVELNLPEDTVITFVPMYKKREKQRGFNQAELLARKMGSLLALSKQQPIRVVKLLEKVKDNRSQVGLNPQERAENVKGVFEYYLPRVSHPREVKSVLLVDDVYTTGATMNECKKVLRKAGVKNIWGFTLSRKMNIQNC